MTAAPATAEEYLALAARLSRPRHSMLDLSADELALAAQACRLAAEAARAEPEAHRCFICDEPFRRGEMVLPDINEGLGHRACFGDGGTFVNLDTGEPLADGEPIPAGEPYDPADYPEYPPAAPAQSSERVQRLQAALEGELDGLAIDDATAAVILAYVDGDDDAPAQKDTP